MALKDLSDPQAVLQAVEEYRKLGRLEFLGKYGFGSRTQYQVIVDGDPFDSKAIAGVAHGYQFPDLGPLKSTEFSGGEVHAAAKLRELGFEVVLEEGEKRSGYWWVNQTQNFDQERSGGYVFAGVGGEGGSLVLQHHTNVSLLQPDDTVLHYASGEIRAIGRVLAVPTQGTRPGTEDAAAEIGHLAQMAYEGLEQPLLREEIPLRLRREEGGPFDRYGIPKQQYMHPVSTDFIAALEDLFPDRWPAGSALTRAARNLWLFQGKPDQFGPGSTMGAAHLGSEGTWTVSRFGKEMQDGDLALFWSTGSQSGLYALGRISGELFERDEPLYTNAEREFAIPYRATLVLDEPVLRTTLLTHPVLKDLVVIQAPQGTNFKVSPEQWTALREVILASAMRKDKTEAPLHVLFKWAADFEPRTIELHREIARGDGSVWWGKFGKPGASSPRRLKDLRLQLEAGTETHAYLYRSGELWRTHLEAITADPDDVDEALMPTYYTKDQCVLFARVSDFEQLDPDWAVQHLVLASLPEPERMPGALGNQTSPLMVLERTATAAIGPSTSTLDFAWLRERTLWPDANLQDLEDTIRSGSQVVLAGPPGTGKTWVAKHLVRYMTKDRPLAYNMVQFHPSYGYEDFIEGLRPTVVDGGIQFERVDGLVLEVVGQMEEGDDLSFIVIDEMNRANLPRVLGELMYLLEYRGEEESINLQYTRGFSLPSNLRFIGTMNTADRSIRSIDTALRRRFEIIECPPDAGILGRYYSTHLNEIGGLVDGFESLNERLTGELDRHHTIGHTFFMKDPMTGHSLDRIWKRQIQPLIEEYFFDQPNIAQEFVLEQFWPGLSG